MHIFILSGFLELRKTATVKVNALEHNEESLALAKYLDFGKLKLTLILVSAVFIELSLEDADAKRFSVVLRERLHELNHKEYSYILVANKLPVQYRGTAHMSW